MLMLMLMLMPMLNLMLMLMIAYSRQGGAVVRGSKTPSADEGNEGHLMCSQIALMGT